MGVAVAWAARASKLFRCVVPAPYTDWLASSSIDSTAPSSATPTNSPRARDQDQISALSWPSVASAALRPTGPAATPASAPRVTLPLTIDSRLRSLRNRSEEHTSELQSLMRPPYAGLRLKKKKQTTTASPTTTEITTTTPNSHKRTLHQL